MIDDSVWIIAWILFIVSVCISLTIVYQVMRIRDFKKDPVMFVHLRKAGGTSIVDMASCLTKYPLQVNGNPYNIIYILKLWEYSPEAFQLFKQFLKSLTVEFVAMEYGFFKSFDNYYTSDLHLITCLRNPYKRFISNYNYDVYRGYVPPCTIEEYIQKDIYNDGDLVNCNKPNYYVTLLCGLQSEPDVVLTAKHLDQAKRNLARFDCVVILEQPETFAQLKQFGLSKRRHSNRTPRVTTFDLTEEEFAKDNTYDYELYEYAKQLAKRKTKTQST